MQCILGLPPNNGASLWCEAAVRVFHIEARLDRMARQHNVALLRGQRVARRHLQLPLHQIVPRDALGHRMLHLQARVHFQEIVIQLVIHDELHRARTAVAHGQCGGHSVFAHGFTHRGADHRRRRFFNHFLAAALGRAVALAQVHRVAMCIGKHLNFNMAAIVDQAFQHQRAVAKRAGRFAARAFDSLL